jgi:hypothetical protein
VRGETAQVCCDQVAGDGGGILGRKAVRDEHSGAE